MTTLRRSGEGCSGFEKPGKEQTIGTSSTKDYHGLG